jgi:hypothetical protein
MWIPLSPTQESSLQRSQHLNKLLHPQWHYLTDFSMVPSYPIVALVLYF